MVDRKEYKHNWYVENKERILAQQKQYRKEHPRPPQERRPKKCPICLKLPAISPHHIKPLAHGGTDNKINILHTCRRCHDILEEYADIGIYYSPSLVAKIRFGMQ